ncbi:MAG: hypothetical protein L0H29_04335, partial [Sinobacteraceae bacterium]|nr:hypothetical protein [Nevskiaceae bacterium]
QRIQRALEIYARSGESPSRLYQQARPAGSDENWLAFAIVPPARAELHARIEARFDAMLEQGFVEEVRALHARVDLQPGLPSVRAVGYRQLWGYLDGQYGFDEARQKALAATRQYAKRQYTWLRSEPAFQHLPQTGALEFLVTQGGLVSGT